MQIFKFSRLAAHSSAEPIRVRFNPGHMQPDTHQETVQTPNRITSGYGVIRHGERRDVKRFS